MSIRSRLFALWTKPHSMLMLEEGCLNYDQSCVCWNIVSSFNYGQNHFCFDSGRTLLLCRPKLPLLKYQKQTASILAKTTSVLILEESYFYCGQNSTTNQMAGFCIKCQVRLKCVKEWISENTIWLKDLLKLSNVLYDKNKFLRIKKIQQIGKQKIS